MATRRERVVLELQDDLTAGILKAAAATKVLDRELDSLSGRAVQADRTTTKLGGGSGGIAQTAKSADRADTSINQLTGRLRVLGEVAAILGPSLIPIGAVGIPAVTGLANQFGVAALAGGVAIGAFQGVGDALKAVNEAALEPTIDNLAKAQAELDKLSPAAQDLVRRLHELGPALEGLRDAGAAGMFPGLIAGIDALEGRLPDVERIVESISSTLGDMLADGGESLASGRWDDFFEFLATDASETLVDLGHIVGDLTHGMAEMWMAFSPLNNDFSSWMVDVADSFDRWATGLDQTEGFQEFVAYIRENGPQVADTMGALGDAVLQLVEASAPLGGPVLAGLEAVAKVIAAIADSDLGTPIMTGVVALSLLNRTMAVTAALSKASLSTGIFAGVGTLRSSTKKAAGSVRADMAAMSDSMVAFGANAEKAGAAATRMKGRIAGLAKGGAVLGGLAVASSGAADGMGVTNTASLALMGTLAGPWGSAVGGSVGLLMDMSAATKGADSAAKSLARTYAGFDLTAFSASAARLDAELDGVAKKTDLLDKLNNPLMKASGIGLASGAISSVLKRNSDDAREMASSAFEGEKAFSQLAVAMGATHSTVELFPKDSPFAGWTEGASGQSISVDVGDLARVAERAAPAMRDLGITVEELASASPGERSAMFLQITDWLTEADSAEGKVRTLGGAFASLDDPIAGVAAAADDLKRALDSLIQPELDQERAMLAWRSGLRNMKDDLAEHSRSLNENTDAGEQNRSAVADRVEELMATVTADAAAGASSDQLAAKLSDGRTKILAAAEAAGLNRKQVEAMVDQMNLTPENITTIVRQVGAEAAIKNIGSLVNNLDAANGKRAKVTVNAETAAARDAIAGIGSLLNNLPRSHTVTFRAVGSIGSILGRADGGTVLGQRAPYGDKVLTYLAPGEEVISNRSGQADRNRALLKAINDNRMADGGTVGIQSLASGGTVSGSWATSSLRAFERALDRATRSLEKEKDARDELRSKRDSFASSLSQSYMSDLFGEQNPWTSKGAGPLGVVRGDLADIGALSKARRSLEWRGLDGDALEAVLSQGSLQQVQAFSQMPKSQVQEFERLFEQRARSAAYAGRSAANAAYGDEVKAQTRVASAQYQEVKRLNTRIARLEKQIKVSSAKNSRDTAAGVGKAVNGAASRGRRNQPRGRA